jgi:hypothetical protein
VEVRQPGIDGQQAQRDPVGRDDAQDAPQVKAPDRNPSPGLQARGDERPVEQKPRDEEEQDHAVVAVVEQLGQRRVHVWPHRDEVVEEDAPGGEAPQRVDQREAGGDLRRGGRLGHGSSAETL